jgi:hypothetical protein
MKNRLDVRGDQRPIIEKAPVDDRLCGVAQLPNSEGKDDKRTENEGEQCIPRTPVVHHAPDRDPEQERGGADGEQAGSEPVEPGKLRNDMSRDADLVQENDNEYESQSDDGKIYVEDPPPGNVLGESCADKRSGYRPNGPNGSQYTKKRCAMGQGDEISDDDLPTFREY